MEAPQQPMKSRKGALLKASVLVAFVAVAIYVIRFTPVKGFLTPAALSRFLEAAGDFAGLEEGLLAFFNLCLAIAKNDS